MKEFKLFLLLMLVSVVPIISSSSLPQITIDLSYKTGSDYDTDNDGVDLSTVDMTVENTVFNWDLDKSKLCTKWDLYSVDYGLHYTICNGYIDCCKLIDLQKTGDNWNDVLYVQEGKYGATTNNQTPARQLKSFTA